MMRIGKCFKKCFTRPIFGKKTTFFLAYDRKKEILLFMYVNAEAYSEPIKYLRWRGLQK